MKHWVVAGINLVPPVHIPSHKERILRREKQVSEPGIPKRKSKGLTSPEDMRWTWWAEVWVRSTVEAFA